jgi:hypothetical protein
MKKVNHEQKLLAALKELGKGQNQIAASLKAKKISGRYSDADNCPMTNFVKKLFPKAKYVGVDGSSIDVELTGDKNHFSVKTPKVIGQFIEAFDASNGQKYPDLLKKD